jgi:hypothetical protein
VVSAMLEVSLPLYDEGTSTMPLESRLLTEESLEHGKAPSWWDLPGSAGNLCCVNQRDLIQEQSGDCRVATYFSPQHFLRTRR